MPRFRLPNPLLLLLPVMLLTPTASEARLTPLPGTAPQRALPQPERETYRYRCDVTKELKGGAISLTRLYTDEGKLDGGDFMTWNLAGYDPSQPRRPLELELSYIWTIGDQPAINPRAIEAKLRLGLDADLPEVAWIQMQRPFPVEPHGIIGSTALSTQVFPYSSHNRTDGHGELPLGDLLAYADGYDTLGWTLIRPSDTLGGSKELASGTIDIAALREAVAALPALRKALAAKTAAPKARCERVLWPDQIRY